MTNQNLKEILETFHETTSLQQLQQYVNQMREVRGFTKETSKDVMLFLTEEMGELAKEIRKSNHFPLDVAKNKEVDVEGEIADVFIYLLSLCNIMNIDLLEAFQQKERKNCKRQWK